MSKISNIRAIIEAHKGQFFSVDFIKQDGTMRSYKNAQVGHKAGHDGRSTVAHLRQYIPIIENMGAGKYQHRNLNLDTVVRLRISGVEYTF